MAEPAPTPDADGVTDHQPDVPEPTPIAELLSLYDRGAFADRVSRDLADLAIQVARIGKKGRVQIDIEVAPAGGNAGDSLLITCKSKTSSPDPEPRQQIWWAGPAGRLLRHDPNQLRIDIDHEGGQQ